MWRGNAKIVGDNHVILPASAWRMHGIRYSGLVLRMLHRRPSLTTGNLKHTYTGQQAICLRTTATITLRPLQLMLDPTDGISAQSNGFWQVRV